MNLFGTDKAGTHYGMDIVWIWFQKYIKIISQAFTLAIVKIEIILF